MWVAQVTELAQLDGRHDEQYAALKRRFPAYQFSMVFGANGGFIVARPHKDTIKYPEDEATELDMLRFIVTSLLDELITGHMITDGQEDVAPPQ